MVRTHGKLDGDEKISAIHPAGYCRTFPCNHLNDATMYTNELSAFPNLMRAKIIGALTSQKIPSLAQFQYW